MKKFLIFLIFFISIFIYFNISYSNCTPPSGDFNISNQLTNCLSSTDLVKGDADLSYGFGGTIKGWINSLSIFLGIGAVLGIVYGSFMLTISAGEDEKINKAKGVIKWSIIGFIGIITASFIINLVVRLFYSLT